MIKIRIKPSRTRPFIFQDSYLHLRFLSNFLREYSRKMERVDKILDFGCGDKPYSLFFKEKCNKYVGVDIYPGENVDTVISDRINSLPFDDCESDLIVCTQVLEQIPDPFAVVREFYRILKTNGKVIVSVPFRWEYHPTPKDYWRFTEDGLAYMFSPFRNVQIIPDSSFLITIIHFLNFLFRDLLSSPFLKTIKRTIISLNNLIGLLLGNILSKANRKLVPNYIVVAEK
jgi:SAM-dependent methyltransferase